MAAAELSFASFAHDKAAAAAAAAPVEKFADEIRHGRPYDETRGPVRPTDGADTLSGNK